MAAPDLSLWSDAPEPSPLIPTENNYLNSTLVIDTSQRTNTRKNRDVPIFSLDQVQFELPAELVSFSVSNNILVMLLKNSHVLRIDLLQAHDILDLELGDKKSVPKKIFLDPTGRHIFVTIAEPQIFYYHSRLGKFKRINKLKGQSIESVAWDKKITTQLNTGSLLMGTSAGLIFEIFIDPSEEHFKKEDKWIKALYSIPDKPNLTGLYYETFPTEPSKTYILATTPNQLYEFIGKTATRRSKGGDYEPVFSGTFTFSEANSFSYEVSNDGTYSEAHYFSKYFERELQSVASSFSWLTGNGIYHGNFVFGSQKPGESLIDNGTLTPYPGEETPISMAMTEFHFILLYPSRLKAISRLELELVYDEPIPTHLGRMQKAHQLTTDVTKRTFWIHTAQNIYELILTQEDRDVWKFYLDKSQYSEALTYAKTTTQKNLVLMAQAEQFFETNRFNLAASYYGRSDAPLEETSLKFIDKDEKDALRAFLLQRLEKLSKKDVTQTFLLGTWLVELYLSKINYMEDLRTNAVKEEKRKLLSKGSILDSDSTSSSQHFMEECNLLVEEFRRFLAANKSGLDQKTTYHLMNSHGRTPELLYFAEITQDYVCVIGHYIQLHQFGQALTSLSKQEDPALFYKFAPILMEHVPEDLVSLLMRNTQLDAKQLIPALLKYKQGDSVHQAIRYLQFVVQKLKNTDPPVHNLLLSLYASQPTESEAQLLQFLVSEAHDRHYSLDYALRLCLQYQRVHSIVLIYGFLGLYEEAVRAALEYGDLELAKINADKADDNPDLRKTLWLSIVRHVIIDMQDIKGAIGLLQQCELLKIEDLLPFFPDFVLIDDFKEEICSALEEYNLHIEEIKHEMEEATRSSEMIRQSIANQKSRFVMLVPEEKCALCDQPVLTRQFYIFPCQHAFHSDCLTKKVSAHIKPSEAQRLFDLQRKLTSEIALYRSSSTENDPPSVNSGSRARKEKIELLKEDLDNLIASECCLCGDLMIKSIEEPFFTDQDFDSAISWMIYNEPTLFA